MIEIMYKDDFNRTHLVKFETQLEIDFVTERYEILSMNRLVMEV